MNKFIEVICGSHLYGLNSEGSDVDRKIVYIPSKEDCFLNKIGKVKQSTSKEEDVEILTIQEFIKQACGGQTNVLDMIHADRDNVLYCSDRGLWSIIQANREKLYTKRMGALAGYCKGQAQKYSFKVEKYNAILELLEILSYVNLEYPLSDFISQIPQNKYVSISDQGDLEVCGRALQKNAPVGYVIECLEKIKDSFGSRVVKCSEIGDKDWKSISHAFRLAYQLIMIYEQGDYYFPLPETKFLKDLKYGKYDYEKDKIGEKLQNLIDKTEKLAQDSKYPKEVDREFWDNIILEFYKTERLAITKVERKLGVSNNAHSMKPEAHPIASGVGG